MAFDLASYAVKARDFGFAPIALYRPVLGPDGQVVRCNCWRGAECPPRSWGKHPVNPGWQKETQLYLDPDHIRREFATPGRNIGCATGPVSGLVIIDIDVDGKPGLDELRRLEAEHGPLPPTPTVITGSDGFHYYFRHPDGITITNSSSGIAPGIDVRGQGGQGVLPPSLHKTGRLYRWVPGRGPHQVELASLPASWLDLLVRHHGRGRSNQTYQRRDRPLRLIAPTMTFDQARALLATMLQHPFIQWACANPNDVSREVWRGIATNLSIPVLQHHRLESAAREAFHAISSDYDRYSESETDRVFDDALCSAETHGPITFKHMQDNGAPDEECESQGGSSLVHAARRTLLRSTTCRA